MFLSAKRISCKFMRLRKFLYLQVAVLQYGDSANAANLSETQFQTKSTKFKFFQSEL